MKKLSDAQQKVIDRLMSDSSTFVIESIYYDWNTVTNNQNDYDWIAFKRPTFDFLVREGYLIRDTNSVVKFKKWVLNNDKP